MIFGIRPIIEAIEAGKEIDKIFIKKDLSSQLSKDLQAIIKNYQIPLIRVPIEKLNRMTRKNHQGVLAILSPITYQHIEDIIPNIYEAGKTPFVVVLDGITDVRNFGAIARTCECAGVDAILIPMRGGAAINADAVKTSAGALLNIPVCRVPDIVDAVRFLQLSGLAICVASEKSTDVYTEVDYAKPMAIVMGAEDVGVSNQIIRISDHIVRVPVLGKIDSLNVSVATGVIAYEVVRQRS